MTITELPPDNTQILPIAEAAKRLGKTEAWYRGKLRDGIIPGKKLGKTWGVTEADIQAAIDFFHQPAINQKAPTAYTPGQRRKTHHHRR